MTIACDLVMEKEKDWSFDDALHEVALIEQRLIHCCSHVLDSLGKHTSGLK